MKRKHFDHFHIAGFTYYDGVLVFNKLKIGTELQLKAEPQNRYDEEAVAIYFGESKLGYVPESNNKALSVILNAGQDIFDARVQRVDKKVHPEQQISVVVFVKSEMSK